MSEKHAKYFTRIVIGAAVFWAIAFFADILVPRLDLFCDPSVPAPGGHGGLAHLLAFPVCLVTIVIALIVCRIKSRKERKEQQNGEHHEYTE